MVIRVRAAPENLRGLEKDSMARARTPERSAPALHRKILSPGVYLWRMFFFLVLVGLVVALLHERLWAAMVQNPGLNFLICFVLVVGIFYRSEERRVGKGWS